MATLDVLGGLSASGFACQALCTSKCDLPHEVRIEKILDGMGVPYQFRPSASGDDRARILDTRRHQVPITIVRLEGNGQIHPPPDGIRTVLASFRKVLEIDRPDVMLTYGGDPVTQGMIAMAKRRGIPVVFAIHNFSYTGVEPFRGVDCCIVPSEFARRHYRERLGLDCRVLSNPVDWDRVRVGEHRPRFVTFVNPVPEKGAFPFVRIAHELGRRRPEIPLLVVESRGTQRTLAACGLDASACGDVQIMANTPDPRQFWRQTRVVLMPSLWWENQPLVAIEAMINGIPVIGSDRGGIPETLGEGGLILPLPDRLTPESRIVPTAEEVEPWVEAIIRLWDDRAFYEEQSRRGRKEALRWHPDRLRPIYAEFFATVQFRAGGSVVGGVSADAPSGLRSSSPRESEAIAANRCEPLFQPQLRRESADSRVGVPASAGPTNADGDRLKAELQQVRAGSEVGSRPRSAQPGEGSRGRLASIIVPCFNQREFTRLCLRALYRHTRGHWELIVVDNGSTDDTAGYLAGVRDGSPVPVTLITNTTNRGFPAAINQGLQAARGEYLVMLNHDAVVTDGWLDQLIALTSARVSYNTATWRSTPEAAGPPGVETEGVNAAGNRRAEPARGVIGLVGPMSNDARPPQGVEQVPYRDLEGMHAFAKRWRDDHRGKWFRTSKLSGSCVLIKRVVYESIGGLDERFGPGLIDDDDLSDRARRAGFELSVAQDLFIHHLGSRTFGGGIDAGPMLVEHAQQHINPER